MKHKLPFGQPFIQLRLLFLAERAEERRNGFIGCWHNAGPLRWLRGQNLASIRTP